MTRQSKAGAAGLGMARHDAAQPGNAGTTALVTVWTGGSKHGRRGMAWPCLARFDRARQAASGAARPDRAWPGTATLACLG